MGEVHLEGRIASEPGVVGEVDEELRTGLPHSAHQESVGHLEADRRGQRRHPLPEHHRAVPRRVGLALGDPGEQRPPETAQGRVELGEGHEDLLVVGLRDPPTRDEEHRGIRGRPGACPRCPGEQRNADLVHQARDLVPKFGRPIEVGVDRRLRPDHQIGAFAADQIPGQPFVPPGVAERRPRAKPLVLRDGRLDDPHPVGRCSRALGGEAHRPEAESGRRQEQGSPERARAPVREGDAHPPLEAREDEGRNQRAAELRRLEEDRVARDRMGKEHPGQAGGLRAEELQQRPDGAEGHRHRLRAQPGSDRPVDRRRGGPEGGGHHGQDAGARPGGGPGYLRLHREHVHHPRTHREQRRGPETESQQEGGPGAPAALERRGQRREDEQTRREHRVGRKGEHEEGRGARHPEQLPQPVTGLRRGAAPASVFPTLRGTAAHPPRGRGCGGCAPPDPRGRLRRRGR